MNKIEIKLLLILLIWKLWTVQYSPKGINFHGILLGLKLKTSFLPSVHDAPLCTTFVLQNYTTDCVCKIWLCHLVPHKTYQSQGCLRHDNMINFLSKLGIGKKMSMIFIGFWFGSYQENAKSNRMWRKFCKLMKS